MGGNSSKGEATKPSTKKNAYSYAKKLGVSKMLFAIEDTKALDMWKEVDSKNTGIIESKNQVSALLKHTVGNLLVSLQPTQAARIKSAKAKLGKSFQPTVQKLNACLARELEDPKTTESFLDGLGNKDKLEKDTYLACVAEGVKITKEGTLEWEYITNSGKKSEQQADAKNGPTTAPPEKPNKGPRPSLAAPGSGLSSHSGTGSHRKTFSVRQLRVLQKGIYRPDSDSTNIKDGKKKDIVSEVLSSVKEVPGADSGTDSVSKKKIGDILPPDLKSIKKDVADGKGNKAPKKTLNMSENWRKKKLKAMRKFATLRGGEEGKKKKKKNKANKPARQSS
mmetsp:Transcript_20600/g.50536  ORF Transcript_20600/g.50536 Transcript_20600/m.50536 type:complete len:336 (+) Transcript_20600:378-1385(+)